MAESTGVEPVSLLREPLFSRQVPYRPAHSPLNCQRTREFWWARWDLNPQKAALEAATYASSVTGLKLEIVQELITQSGGWTES
jgi:hypothetical protein